MPRSWLIGAAAWAPALMGLIWILCGAAGSGAALALAAVPASLLLAAGVGHAFQSGDERPRHWSSAWALGSAGWAVLSAPALGLVSALLLGGLSGGLFVLLGHAALAARDPIPGVPSAPATIWLAARASSDEALMAVLHHRFRSLPERGLLERLGPELDAVLKRSEEQGWNSDPDAYHRQPPAPGDAELTRRQHFATPYEHLRFDSGFRLHPGEPPRPGFGAAGASEAQRTPNHDVHAWVVRHADARRPWVVAINGYRMGEPWGDFGAFVPERYHGELGLNLVIYVPPLHGPRRLGRSSGDGFFDSDPLPLRYAEAQAVWDLRRLIGWIRAQGGERIGVAGLSMGGFAAALLASLEELDFVIAGTPVTDLARSYLQHSPPVMRRELASLGATPERIEQLLLPVSPLHLRPRVPKEARYIYGGVADRIVPPDHFRDLYAHWEEPRMRWYAGAHIARQREFWDGTVELLRSVGIVA